MQNKHIVIVTGLSGAGKTSALNILEDIGFYTIDNLPLGLEKSLFEINISKLAVGIDIRTFKNTNDFFEWINFVKKLNIKTDIIFLEADISIILGRYNLSRRAHPIRQNTLLESINKEISILNPIKEISNFIVDTTNLKVVELEKKIKSFITDEIENDINVHLQSFGFKYGIPRDSDLIFDVRFIPNPYYIKKLKEKNGYDTEIIDFIFSKKESIEFYEKLKDMLNFLLPQYIAEGKKHLTISIGCSGGKHRSVAFVNKLYEDLIKFKNIKVYLYHREKEIGNW